MSLVWRTSLSVCLGLAGCAAPSKAPVEARSLDGRDLRRPELGPEVLADRLRRLEVARAAFEANPDDVDAAIWLGRRTAYLGRYGEAVRIFSDAIRKHPGEPRLYRHRGHRFLTLRQLDRAVADLEKAASLIHGKPDRIEADGLPNARNTPTSTLHSNVWYHLGLAHYARGEFDRALDCYRSCLAVSRNPDMLVATTYWLYNTLCRLGRTGDSEPYLRPIHAGLDVIENHDYHALLLLFRGERRPSDVLPANTDSDSVKFATVGYGIASWHAARGESTAARAMLERVVQGANWAAFGHLAAEAHLRRL